MFFDQVYSKSLQMSFNRFLEKSDNLNDIKSSILLLYSNKEEFLKYAKFFEIMNDFKEGVPRTAYLGVVRVYFNQHTVYLAPAQKTKWQAYDPQWISK